jgi:molybdopterin synthase catalytic subunit
MIRSAIVREPIDVAKLITSAASADCGAISVFLGSVRNRNDGRAVTGMEYSAYEPMAEKELERLTADAAERFGVRALIVEHRVGTLTIGDASVVIVAAAEHRSAAMECTRVVIEAIKSSVPIWKREHYADGTREWVDPTRAASSSFAT